MQERIWHAAPMGPLSWDELRYFLSVHRAGTLAQAGAALNVSPTTVGRRLNAFEEGLGTRLFERHRSGFRLTPAGARLLERAERMECEMLALERELAGRDQELAGRVRLTATEMLTTRFIAPNLGGFRKRYPNIQLELVCTSKPLDLARREADVSLRVGRPRQPGLIIRRLASIDVGLYGGRRYFERRARGQSDAAHEVIAFDRSAAFARENDWLDTTLSGASVVLRSTSVSSIYAACVAGLGLALLPCIAAEGDDALLRHDIDASPPEPRSVWQAVHEDVIGAARVRAVLDYTSMLFGAEPHAGMTRDG